MSVAIYVGEGTARIKEGFANEFKEKVCKIFGFEKQNLSEFERVYNQIMLDEDGLLQFLNHTYKPVIDKFIEMVKENVDKIEDAEFKFNCHSVDNPKPKGTPTTILIEVNEGNVYVQTWVRHLPLEFYVFVKKDEWFDKVYDEISECIEKARKEDVEHRKNKPKKVENEQVGRVEDNDLPF